MESAAGIEDIEEEFGFAATLDSLADGSFKEEDYIIDLNVYRVLRKIQLKSHQAAYQRNLNHQMELKMKQ